MWNALWKEMKIKVTYYKLLLQQKSYSPDTIFYGRTDGQTDHYRASATKWRGPNYSQTYISDHPY
jgi:hypothetical protein